MKKMKKMASFLLAMLMALALAVPAMAATEGGDTNDNTPAVRTYEIYQIFTGDYFANSEGEGLADIYWGINAKAYNAGGDNKLTEEEKTTVLAAINGAEGDNATALAVAEYLNADSIPCETGTETSYTGLESGYYLIKDSWNKEGPNQDHTLYVVQVTNGNLNFTPKIGTPEVEKKIVEGDKKQDSNEAAVGEVVSYEITGTMPANIDKYTAYTYVFVDTFSKGLDFVTGSVVVKVNGTDVTGKFTVTEPAELEDGSTSIKIGIQDIFSLKESGITIDKDTKVVVTYDAKVNHDAVIGGTVGNPNDVELWYSHDPNKGGDGTWEPSGEPTVPCGKTPKDTVTTFVTELKIHKYTTDEQGNKVALAGAGFTLKGDNLVEVKLSKVDQYVKDPDGDHWLLANGTYTTEAPDVSGGDTDNSDLYASTTDKYKLVTVDEWQTVSADAKEIYAEVDANGDITFTGLAAGEYTIVETKTPTGYNTIEDIKFEVTFNTATNKFEVTITDPPSGVVESDNKLSIDVLNNSGATLPETGGIGTTIFYVVGGALVIGAVVLLVTKKRMSNIEE